MSATKFTEENQAAIVASVGDGASLPDAARATDIRPSTVKAWITRGKREDDGPYASFVEAIESAREEFAARPAPLTEEQFQRHLDDAVRAGSVTAMKLWSERNFRRKDDPAPSTSKIASLAEQRRKRAAG